jgi:hypothetical protein
MPLLRYFTFVGGALMALLFVVSSCFPVAEAVTHRDVIRPVIRIASDRVGPPRVEFDTRVQMAAVPALVPDMIPQAPAREAYAQFVAPLPTRAAPIRIDAAPVRIEHKKTRIAKRPDHPKIAANHPGLQPFHWTW